MKKAVSLLILAAAAASWQAPAPPAGTIVVAKLKYGGGGDWYVNPTSLPNLHRALSEAGFPAADTEDDVVADVMSDDVFNYPILFMTGHGDVRFTDDQLARLRAYLERGGFLFVDDNYGLDDSWRRECARLFPDAPLTELPADHDVFHCYYDFPAGVPKVHEHHGGPGRAYAVFRGGRMVIFYSYNTDLGDGWEDADVHGDPAATREAALRMGVNVVVYALTR